MAKSARSKVAVKRILGRLAEFVGPTLKIANRRFEPDRHRLLVDITYKGKVPADSLKLATTFGRKISSLRIRSTSEPGAFFTRWSAEVVMAGLGNGERLIAEVSHNGRTKVKTRSIKSPVPKHMRNPKTKPPPARGEEHRLSASDLDLLRKVCETEKETALVPIVTYFPKFDNPEEFSDHYHRASWYLTGAGSPVKEACFGLMEEMQPGPRPTHFCDPTGDDSILKLRTDAAAYDERLARSKVILVWKDIDQSVIEALKKKYPDRAVLSVSINDVTSIEYGRYCEAQWRVLSPVEQSRLHESSAAIVRAKLEALKHCGRDKAVVFGTGPSIEAATSYDFSDSVTIVCNSAITSDALMDHINPDFVCAGDVVSHFGVSAYAGQFRDDLVKFLQNNDVLFFTTSKFGYLLQVKYPELGHKITYCEQKVAGGVTDLNEMFALPMLDSTLNIHMLPLAASVADTIYILGCDGKNPEPEKNEDFWPHSTLAQYHDLVESGHLAHPTFDLNRQLSTHDRYLASTEASLLAGEVFGKRFFSLVPSYTPPLAARALPPFMVQESSDGLIHLKGDTDPVEPRRRVLLVSRASPAHFSGGRYHALLMAEALALGGDDVVLWLDNMPRWYHNLALLEGHQNIKLHLDSHQIAPQGDFDVVIVVPDHTPNSDLYTGALSVAKETGAIMVLINFESPNWFNAMTPSPKPVDNWRYWFATGAYSDAILSLADIGTEYAREFYTDVPETCLLEAANPVINTRAADLVRSKGVQVEDQIISISRFGKGTEHKNVHAITALLSEATRGFTLALIVGTGAYPSEAEIALIKEGLAPYEMKLKLLHNISDIEKFEEIAKSRCMIFQSLFEGFGYPPIEAQYMDRPCVAYDLPVLREFSDGAIDFVPLGDEAAMGKALGEVLARGLPEDGSLRKRLESFATPEAMDAKMTRILEAVQARPRAVEAYERNAFLALADGMSNV